ncbi:MAG: hypothetical protein JW743_02185 [Deltaproteobacteria bacterium]|nr:hypothetical protein [Deltaproteobacteria bacterium]MBN2844660.1 hypothetical protein [Deltaproteobacteria bacterium]
MRLKDIDWNGGKGAEEVVIWGIKPIQWLLELFDETFIQEDLEPEDERATWFYYELRDKVDELERYLMKIDDAAHDRKRSAPYELTEEEKELIDGFIKVAKRGGPHYDAIKALVAQA